MLINLQISGYMRKNKLTRLHNYALISVGCTRQRQFMLKIYALITNKNPH